MDALLLVLSVGVALLIAYFTYGRWVAGRVFQLRKDTPTPATVFNDNQDYCPTRRGVVFGHHFTSIAGTGPIVGPAIAVMWGWLPAVLWVVFGSIFIGAVHDLGSLVVSLRNKGRSVGDIAGDLLGPRVRLIFLSILVMALWVVLAIFGLVIASVLRQYPGAIFPVLAQIPLAVGIGFLAHRKGKSIFLPSMLALAAMYASVIWGDVGPLHSFNQTLAAAPMWAWVVGLLAYAYVASVLPVWSLLQPRDYINALQLISALALIVAGLIAAATIGGAPDQSPERERGVAVAPIEDFDGGTGDSPVILASTQEKIHHGGAENTEGNEEWEVGDAGSERSEAPDQRPIMALPAAQVHDTDSDRPKLEIVAPIVNWRPEGAPPLLPVLFITVACGAISGFHCLVASGTTSKQVQRETDAHAVGFGSMLTEAFLATLVIAACAAGIGLGISKPLSSSMMQYGSWTMKSLQIKVRDGDVLHLHRARGPFGGVSANPVSDPSELDENFSVFRTEGENVASLVSGLGPEGNPRTLINRGGDYLPADHIAEFKRADGPWFQIGESEVSTFADENLTIRGPLAWDAQYQSWSSAQGLAATVGAFVEGSANFVESLGISASVAVALMGVLVASFAGTTMDTACRLQRYVVQELSRTFLPTIKGPCCAQCGYDFHGLPVDAGSERTPVREGPDQIGAQPTGETPVPPASASMATSPTFTCPECGALNSNEEVSQIPWEAIRRDASPFNPFKWLATKHGATLFAVVTALILAAVPAPGQSWSVANFGQGGLILWPLFGATNQLLGGLAFLVIGAWLIAHKRPWWFITLPALFMLVVPAWALVWQAFVGNESNASWVSRGDWILVAVTCLTLALEVWLVLEVALRAHRAHHPAHVTNLNQR